MEDKESKSEPSALIELIKVTPSLLWITLAIGALVVFYSPLTKIIEQGQVKEFQFGALQIKMVERVSQAVVGVSRKEIGELADSRALLPLINRFQLISTKIIGANVLWVDDHHPTQNFPLRRVVSAFGMRVDMARSTKEALDLIDSAKRNGLAKYDVIISDMGRDNDEKAPCFGTPEPSEAGCHLAKKIAELKDGTPLIIYSAYFSSDIGTPAFAFALTKRSDHVIHYVFDALERRVIP